MSCRRRRPHLIDLLHGSLAAARRSALEAHLNHCQVCRDTLAELAATLELYEEHGRRAPVPARLDHVWTRLEPQLDEIDRAAAAGSARRNPGWRIVRWAVAASLLLLIGIGAVRWLGRPAAGPAPSTAAVAPEPGSDAEEQLARYLGRSRPLLYALANRDPQHSGSPAYDLGSERRVAARLAGEAELLRSALQSREHRREAALLFDLQLLFLQVANLPERDYRDGLSLVQETIEQRSVLFEMDLWELRRTATTT